MKPAMMENTSALQRKNADHALTNAFHAQVPLHAQNVLTDMNLMMLLMSVPLSQSAEEEMEMSAMDAQTALQIILNATFATLSLIQTLRTQDVHANSTILQESLPKSTLTKTRSLLRPTTCNSTLAESSQTAKMPMIDVQPFSTISTRVEFPALDL